MQIKLLKSKKIVILNILFLIYFGLFSAKIHSQCAGSDNSITICDIGNPANQNINLFTLLTGTPTAGGTWSDDDTSGGLDVTTGILNLWDVSQGGIYKFTYTVAGVAGCTDDSSTVTITIGSYAGVPSDKGSACNDDNSVNLFQFFAGSTFAPPQSNGTWTDNDNTGALIKNIFNATLVTPGVYDFSYKVPAVGTCPETVSNVTITVYKLPRSGTPSDIKVCSIDVGTLTNVNLLNQLTNKDAGGKWVEVSGTNQLTFPGDTTINVQNIYNTRGAGTYTFTYTVKPVNPICSEASSTVNVIIEEKLDFTDATLVVNSDICENLITTAKYTGVLTQGTKNVPDGSYKLTYTVTVGGAGTETLTANFAGGVLSFPINPAFLNAVGKYTITINAIKSTTSPDICTTTINVFDDLNIFPIPKIDNATLTIPPVCENSDVTVQFDDVTLADGNYEITYDLSGSNVLSGTKTTINVVAGKATFVIPAISVPKALTTTIKIGNIVNETTGCSNTVNVTKDFFIEEQLDFTGGNLVVNSDICENLIPTAKYTAVINQGTKKVSDGPYRLSYAVTGSGTGAETLTSNFLNGVLSFPLNEAFFTAVGKYTITINDIKSTTSPGVCTPIINLSDDLNILPIPKINNAILTIVPVCKNSDVTVEFDDATLADGNYEITYDLTGSNISTGTKAPINVVAGKATFVIPAASVPKALTTTIKIVNIVNVATGCSNAANVTKDFIINDIPDSAALKVVINDACLGASVPVNISGLGNLTDVTLTYDLTGLNTAAAQTIKLLVAAGNTSFILPAGQISNTGKSTLTITQVLVNPTGCTSPTIAIADDFSINTLPVKPADSTVAFCESENATIAQLTPTGTQYQWFESLTSTTPLASSTILVTGNYYVQENSNTSCSSPRATITVTVNSIAAPVLAVGGEKFCGLDKPTISNLSSQTTATGAISWYDAPTGGKLLSSTDKLVEGATYYAFSKDANCTSKNSLAVTVSLTECDKKASEVFIPNGFSPNEDGVNDTFKIVDIEYSFPNFTLEIYNRYGNLMFKGDKTNPEWEGKSTVSSTLIDSVAPNGVYFYIVNFNKNNEAPKQGQVYLNR